ncbi:hypothetical protein CQA66_00390 [Helicobacter aurati]|uniref:Modification methylase n=1 Tax=Helicobacter aurati TaxID=137778 RepID=A0A3D8J8C5_9HELI|nr:adenine-specific methyltransferase EcoRI family protein [Helicobacter aurati]RDU73682.1 hypothetical protein CQA66_00390 [Helicobacter aurati]
MWLTNHETRNTKHETRNTKHETRNTKHRSQITHKNEFIKNPKLTPLKENGDFRSNECLALLQQSDIVVTNPPFSLFREYVAKLIEYQKKFLIIGNLHAITYKDFFPYLKDNKIWQGYTHPKLFLDVNTGTKEAFKLFGNIGWYTNLAIKKRSEILETIHTYAKNPEKYPKYDNYDAININKTNEIPMDYEGVMGVPVTFLDKHNPEQFEILGIDRYIKNNPNYGRRFKINNKEIYARILIRRIMNKRE